jgi:hypothetical protein
MKLEEYHNLVSARARDYLSERYNLHKVCSDTIKPSFKEGKTVAEAVLLSTIPFIGKTAGKNLTYIAVKLC